MGEDIKKVKTKGFGEIEVKQSSYIFKGSFEWDKEGVMMPKVSRFDSSDKVMLFRSKGIKKILFGLSPSTIKLFLYIAYMMPKTDDKIKIRAAVFMRLLGVKSRNTFYTAVKELTECNVIKAVGEKIC